MSAAYVWTRYNSNAPKSSFRVRLKFFVNFIYFQNLNVGFVVAKTYVASRVFSKLYKIGNVGNKSLRKEEQNKFSSKSYIQW